MKKKLYYLPWVLLPLLLAMSLPAAALAELESIAALALVAQPESVGVSPPGWLGGALAVLSLILPVAAWLWLRREND